MRTTVQERVLIVDMVLKNGGRGTFFIQFVKETLVKSVIQKFWKTGSVTDKICEGIHLYQQNKS